MICRGCARDVTAAEMTLSGNRLATCLPCYETRNERRKRVAETSAAWYRSSDFQPTMTEQQKEVIAALIAAGEALTLKEITERINRQHLARPIPDSTVSGRLNELKDLSLVTNASPKRKCRINGILKLTWRATEMAKGVER
jgi:hypothetical protein